MRLKILIILILFSVPASCKRDTSGRMIRGIAVSENHHFLSTADGEPFFWLGDTGWLLFRKLNREEAARYLEDRKQKGFNVIQAVLIHDLRNNPNVYGDSAVSCGRADRPAVTRGNSFSDPVQYDYWDHVDYIIRLAAEKGIYMALVPIWGSNVKSGLVNSEQASAYAAWIASRYKDEPNIIWINGGDIKGSDSLSLWNAIGHTIKTFDPYHLITFHPFGRTQSSTWFHNQSWLDFNMFQSGHRRYDQDTSGLAYGEDNWRYMESDYNLIPARPSLDGEPSYEAIPQGLHDPLQPYWNDDDVRRYAYWSVFTGGFGFTYGHNAVMQFHKYGDESPAYGVKENWEEALNAPGASQMIFLKKLMLSRSFFDRVPAQDIIAQNGVKYDRVVPTKGKNFAFVYTFTGSNINIITDSLYLKKFKASWFNPRTGEYKLSDRSMQEV